MFTAALAVVIGQPTTARVGISTNGAASSCVDRRPPAAERRFVSPAVDAAILHVASAMNDSELACLFSNTLPNTLDTTVVAVTEPPEPPDSFVITGDIPAMWLRDATNQVLPYLRFVKQDPRLARMLSGLIARQTAQVLADPYANAHTQHAYESSPHALDATSSPGFGPSRLAGMRPGIFERKYELDSLMAFLKLSRSYYSATRDKRPFGAQWRSAVASVRAVVRGLQASSAEEARLPAGPAYTFVRASTSPTDTLLHGVG